MPCSFKGRDDGIPIYVAGITFLDPLRISASLPPHHPFMLTYILACLLVLSIDRISEPPLCSIKGSVLGRKQKEQVGGSSLQGQCWETCQLQQGWLNRHGNKRVDHLGTITHSIDTAVTDKRNTHPS